MPAPPDKLVIISGSAGSGKSTLAGNLLYKFGGEYGVNIMSLERLQQSGINKYDKIVDFLLDEGTQPIIETRKHIVSIEVESSTSSYSNQHNCLVYVVDASNAELKDDSLTTLQKAVENATRVLFVVNKMDLVNWDESAYKLALSNTLKAIGMEATDLKNFITVPTSATTSENILERSDKASWHSSSPKSPTDGSVVDMLDQVLDLP